MALIDELRVHIKAGKGGDGVVRWIHEKFKEFGGPGGGDGGRGGSVYAKGVRDSWHLAHYRHTKEFSAENGKAGGNHHMKGADGEDLVITVPVGSVLHNLDTGDVFHIDEVDEKVLVLKGGNGGLGNDYFKSSTNQRPEQSTPGKPGEEANFFIEVELIAEAGLIGLPNAGKSSLLNSLTRAGVKTGDYAFTTLEPNLGSLYGHIIADIPGLIEGASEGKGLGHKFLRHIRRTKMLIHCISLEHFVSEGDDSSSEKKQTLSDVYNTIKAELGSFDAELLNKKELIVLTKSDILNPDQEKELISYLKAEPTFKSAYKSGDIRIVNILDDATLKTLSDELTTILDTQKAV